MYETLVIPAVLEVAWALYKVSGTVINTACTAKAGTLTGRVTTIQIQYFPSSVDQTFGSLIQILPYIFCLSTRWVVG